MENYFHLDVVSRPNQQTLGHWARATPIPSSVYFSFSHMFLEDDEIELYLGLGLQLVLGDHFEQQPLGQLQCHRARHQRALVGVYRLQRTQHRGQTSVTSQHRGQAGVTSQHPRGQVSVTSQHGG